MVRAYTIVSRKSSKRSNFESYKHYAKQVHFYTSHSLPSYFRYSLQEIFFRNNFRLRCRLLPWKLLAAMTGKMSSS